MYSSNDNKKRIHPRPPIGSIPSQKSRLCHTTQQHVACAVLADGLGYRHKLNRKELQNILYEYGPNLKKFARTKLCSLSQK